MLMKLLFMITVTLTQYVKLCRNEKYDSIIACVVKEICPLLYFGWEHTDKLFKYVSSKVRCSKGKIESYSGITGN